MWLQMIFAESAGEEYIADGKGRQIFYKNSVALFGVDLIVLGWHSWTLMGLDLNSDLVT